MASQNDDSPTWNLENTAPRFSRAHPMPRIKIVRPILHAACSREYHCYSHASAEKMVIILRIVHREIKIHLDSNTYVSRVIDYF